MAAWLNLFMLIGIARPAQIILGLFALLIGVINIKDFFAFKKGISLSIPESSKPGLYKRVRNRGGEVPDRSAWQAWWCWRSS